MPLVWIWHGLRCCIPILLFLFPQSTPSPSADLLGLGGPSTSSPGAPPAATSGSLLVDVFADTSLAADAVPTGAEENFER